MERRQANRFPVAFPVTFENGSGTTRDVSAAGVFFESDWSPPVGGLLRIELVFDRACPGPLGLQCEGHVVRVESVGENGVGVAVHLLSYRFEPRGNV